jgi:hypothetical protein
MTVSQVLMKRFHINELKSPGDYCFDSEGRVIMACPVCALVFLCKHEVVQREPLTLSPSVVGPAERRVGEQVLSPCAHHFWVLNDEAIDIR